MHFSAFQSKERPKNHAKNFLMLLFDHYVSKIYQKVPNWFNIRVWPKGFCHPFRSLWNDFCRDQGLISTDHERSIFMFDLLPFIF